jgi:hypothetical protein
MNLKLIMASCAIGASLLAAAATPASANDFFFSFTNDVGNVTGTVTGEVFGLTDNATSSATSVLIDSWPSALIPASEQADYIPPLDAITWISQFGNSFVVLNDTVVSGAFHADNQTADSTLDRLWINFGPCSSGPTCSFLSLGTNDTQFVWTGVAGTTFCAADTGLCNNVGGATPEPAAWTVMLLGFGGLGSMLRAKKLKIARADA